MRDGVAQPGHAVELQRGKGRGVDGVDLCPRLCVRAAAVITSLDDMRSRKTIPT